MKDFREEIKRYLTKVQNGEHFAFSKFADGEWMAIQGHQGTPGNGEWIISPETEISRNLLAESFLYDDPDYHIGISCPCCQGDNHYTMRRVCNRNEENVTYANLFVNANYPFYVENFIPEFRNHSVVLVANEKSDVEKLPFKVDFFHGIGYNGWVENLDLIDTMIEANYQNKLVLFSAGPLGNILCHQLHSVNKNNIYLDIGSTLDGWLRNDVRNPRGYYHQGSPYHNKVCTWGNLTINDGIIRYEGILR